MSNYKHHLDGIYKAEHTKIEQRVLNDECILKTHLPPPVRPGPMILTVNNYLYIRILYLVTACK